MISDGLVKHQVKAGGFRPRVRPSPPDLLRADRKVNPELLMARIDFQHHCEEVFQESLNSFSLEELAQQGQGLHGVDSAPSHRLHLAIANGLCAFRVGRCVEQSTGRRLPHLSPRRYRWNGQHA